MYFDGEMSGAGGPGEPFDPDVATIRSLSLITGGDPLEFTEHDPPPSGVRRWLRTANLRQARGLLLETLRRWHELRR